MKQFIQTKLVELPVDDSRLSDVRATFSLSARFVLQQAWLAEPEAAFRPGVVTVGWKPGEFLVFAELEDVDIFSDAIGLNDNTWEKGDVFEIFLRNMKREEYQEFHITPNNCKLQLRIPSLEALVDRQKRHAVMKGFELSPEVFRSRVWIEKERWSVLARIPFGELQLPESPVGTELAFSFSRYDYTRGQEPILSSTSCHRELNFHRQQEWNCLALYPR